MLEVSGLAVARGGRRLLEGVSFTVPEGGALVLRGANGIGKTTLLRTLAGLQPAEAGRVTGAETAAYASHADGVKAALSVTENLTFWAELYDQPFDSGVLTTFDLAGLADRPAGTLSSGQRRRLGLARLALIGRRLLLLDEPTVSLDAGSVRRFGAWLAGTHLAGGGMAVIATHIDLGLEAPVLDLTAFRAAPEAAVAGGDEAFL
ncbi:heme ABC exporter ATP-binding protein CcmA [Pseudoroseicyclus sp. H15]